MSSFTLGVKRNRRVQSKVTAPKSHAEQKNMQADALTYDRLLLLPHAFYDNVASYSTGHRRFCHSLEQDMHVVYFQYVEASVYRDCWGDRTLSRTPGTYISSLDHLSGQGCRRNEQSPEVG